MAFNLNTIKNAFTRRVQLKVANDKGTDDIATIKCDFRRITRDEAQEWQDRIDQHAIGSIDRESAMKEMLREVWRGWDLTSDDGPMEFNEENREYLYNVLPGSLREVYTAYIFAILGVDRKNA